MKEEIITCSSCHIQFSIAKVPEGLAPHYCPFCRTPLKPEEHPSPPKGMASAVSFLTEHLPSEEQIQFVIGPYQVLQSIGKGGMGEVFLAYDTTCGRRLALKKIRPDLVEHKQLHNRFLKEARITSQLTHPAIIPIYAIHSEGELTYYTMPFVEGETLKQLLRRARQQEKKGEKIDQAASIPALIRIFLSICQAIAYVHSKHILHRDLKPENIIVGHYGQIVILDWGLAKLLRSTQEKDSDSFLESPLDDQVHHHLTHIGRVVGTVSYMAPERALGQPANFQTDIYSLGVILYQLLTLKPPFFRPSLTEFRQNMHQEKLIDPIEIAPYRDIPRSLSRVVMKCLAPLPEHRYQTVDELIHDLENYIEGRSEWFQIAELDPSKKDDWEFQENVFIPEHIALTREMEASNWVNLMISKASFQENIKLEATVKIGERGNGIGFLLSVPEAAERTHLNDGYHLWLGSDTNKSTKMLRSTVEVIQASEIFLKRHEWYSVCIEKNDSNIHFYLNDVLQFSYIGHLPLVGTHIGLLSQDADFSIKDFFVYVGSQNVTVNCLAVPDAFLAHKDFTIALNEYRRIGYSFPGRAEGREAMFRAGITLLEQANTTSDQDKKSGLYDLAQEEFHKLYGTPGAPLEYLGKALIYEALGDYEEEAKCFELAYRRYPRHPLLPVLQEQIVYRMHESSRFNRQATFNFILLALKYMPAIASNLNTKKLLNSLEKYWESLFFIENDPNAKTSEELRNLALSLRLAFWLARPYTLCEIIDKLPLKIDAHIPLCNAIFCLIELGSWRLAQKQLENMSKFMDFKTKSMLEIAILKNSTSIEAAVEFYVKHASKAQSYDAERTFLYLMEQALDEDKPELVHLLYKQCQPLSSEAQLKTQAYVVWAYLLEKQWDKAGEILHAYPIEFLSQETSLFHFLYGCWLYVAEGREIAHIHFSAIYEVPYPHSWTLFSYYLKGKIIENQGWMLKSFLWERRQLYRQLSLFYHCIGEKEKALHFQQKTKEEAIDAAEI